MERFEFNGVSQFFYFAIPAVLAVSALWWLAFAESAHSFRRLLSQEKRHAEIVGASRLPKEPIKITIDNSRDESIEVDRAEIDGQDLWVYYKNNGPGQARSIQLEWRLIAPDGTVLKAQKGLLTVYAENTAAGALDAGERGEAKYKLPTDPRAVALDLRMSHGRY